MTCAASGNQTIACDGAYMAGEGLCLRHAILFDVWIARGGFRVYTFNPPDAACKAPTIGRANPPGLRRWKRRQFHLWLDTLTLPDVDRIMES